MCRGINCLVLFLANSLLLVIGIIFLTGGCILNYNKHCLRGLLKVGLTFLGELITDDINAKIDGAVLLLEQMAAPVGYVFLVFGIIIIFVAALALIGLCCRVRCMVKLYAVIIGLVLFAHTIFVIVYFIKKDIIMNRIRLEFYRLVMGYRSVNGRSLKSIALTILMPAMGCCGYLNGGDFFRYSHFERTDYFGGHKFINVRFPIACCKLENLGPGDRQCPTIWTTDNSNVLNGCGHKITGLVNDIILWTLVAIWAELIVFVLTLLHIRWTKESVSSV